MFELGTFVLPFSLEEYVFLPSVRLKHLAQNVESILNYYVNRLPTKKHI